MTTIGLLNPGEMGSMVGAAVRSTGARVLWAGEGRSAATRKRASDAGLEDAGSVGSVVRASEVILSVCPPHAAVDVASQVAALGSAEGVEDSLVREWKISQPDLSPRAESAAKSNAKKAWRFIGEMEEIAATFAAAGLPDGFHQGAAEIYRRMEIYKDGPSPSFTEVLRALTPRRPA